MSAQSYLFGEPVVETQLELDLSRGKANPHSQKAHERLKPHKASMRERIRGYIWSSNNGATLKELCEAFGKLPNEISGRLSELKRGGQIRDSGRERDGCAVYVMEAR